MIGLLFGNAAAVLYGAAYAVHAMRKRNIGTALWTLFLIGCVIALHALLMRLSA